MQITIELLAKDGIIILRIGKVVDNMKITDVRLRRIENQNRLKAVASITINDAFAVHELRVIEGSKGIFVAMPSRKNKSGVFKDVAHPINSETRALIEAVVLEKYHETPEPEKELADDSLVELSDDAPELLADE